MCSSSPLTPGADMWWRVAGAQRCSGQRLLQLLLQLCRVHTQLPQVMADGLQLLLCCCLALFQVVVLAEVVQLGLVVGSVLRVLGAVCLGSLAVIGLVGVHLHDGLVVCLGLLDKVDAVACRLDEHADGGELQLEELQLLLSRGLLLLRVGLL